jgi:hypothetical protein
MLTRTKWVVAGGAAALVITPVVAVYASPTADAGPEQRGLVIDAEAANRARAERVAPTAAPTVSAVPTVSATPTATAAAKAKPAIKPTGSDEPTGKKTVSAVSPISPTSPKSPKSPDTPG